MKNLFLKLIRLYQMALSPYFPASCRFEPSCSSYWIEAIEARGVGRGIWLGLRRLLRCHPFARGGVDPVVSYKKPHPQVILSPKGEESSNGRSFATLRMTS